MREPRSTGVTAFGLRRASGVVLSLYLAFWAVGVVSDPGRPFLVDLRGYGLVGQALELFLIAVIAGHALDGVAQVVIERTRGARRHRSWFVAVAASTAIVLVLHVPFVLGML